MKNGLWHRLAQQLPVWKAVIKCNGEVYTHGLLRLVVGVVFLLWAHSLCAQEWQWSVPVPGEKRQPARAFLWIPPECSYIRAVVIAQNNMEELSILENRRFRAALSRLGIGEIWVSPAFSHYFDFKNGAGEVFNRFMQQLADSSGYAEIKLAPVIAIGHSAAASWPYYFAAWNPGRTLAAISVSGQWPYVRNPQFSPDIWSRDQNMDFIPCLETMGEYEAADTWSAEGLKERQEHPLMPLSMLACPAEGHFAATQKKIDYLCLYIRKAVQYRLPGHTPKGSIARLRPIDPFSTGWLAEKWQLNKPPGYPAAPVAQYKGDRSRAFWFFDKEMALATMAYESAFRNRQPLLLGYMQQGRVVPQHNTHLQVSLKYMPEDDGITFHLNAVFLDTVPGESPRPAAWTQLAPGSFISHPSLPAAIDIQKVIGPFRKISDTVFRIGPGKETDEQAKNMVLTFAACYPGDARYKSAVQQAEMIAPAQNKEGAPQHISFPPIPPVSIKEKSVTLRASSDAGLPVHYYVLDGPAIVKGSRLYFTAIPARARFPVKVTVVAWQYGRQHSPAIQSASRVFRVIDIQK